MTSNSPQSTDIQRPEFMILLGLLPPYSVEDVRMAYREKAKAAHPDRGGSQENFLKLKEAYDKALEYAEFRKSRRQWLGAQMERYVLQEEVVNEIRRRSGKVNVEPVDWMKNSIGPDFSIVTERLRTISMRGEKDLDSLVDFIKERSQALGFLISLDLAGVQLSERAIHWLASLQGLKRLNLAETNVTANQVKLLLEALKKLESINLSGTNVGWFNRQRLGWVYPKLKIETAGKDANS